MIRAAAVQRHCWSIVSDWPRQPERREYVLNGIILKATVADVAFMRSSFPLAVRLKQNADGRHRRQGVRQCHGRGQGPRRLRSACVHHRERSPSRNG